MFDERKLTEGAGRVLLLDAVASGVMGLLLAGLAGTLAAPLGLPVGLLRGAGLALLPFAATVGFVATAPSVRSLYIVIGCNTVWVAASVLLLVSGVIAPTPLGTAFVLTQATAVAIFAVLQRASVRASRARLA
jgi:predicted neutral ceramidase superfamily lipid hydrolase